MPKYIVEFSKEGIVKYTSHLDLLRLFKRTFKKTGIILQHSQGFNPHPKMSFVQALSLGYESQCELIEIETVEEFTTEEIAVRLQSKMPQGISILSCKTGENRGKSLGALLDAAEYKIILPINVSEEVARQIVSEYMAQENIQASKRQKKTKKYVDINIRDKIRNVDVLEAKDTLKLKVILDCGSESNLSPELLINSLCTFAKWEIKREKAKVYRKRFIFDI